MSFRTAFLALVAATPLVQTGCDTGLQTKLYAARDTRYAAARDTVYSVEAARNQALIEALDAKPAPAPEPKPGEPAPAEAPKPEVQEHPMMTWRKSATTREDAALLRELAARAKAPQPTSRQISRGEATEKGSKFRRLWYDCTVAEVEGKFIETCEPWQKVMAMGTPAQPAAEVGAAFLKDVNEYWTSASTLSRYLQAIANYDMVAKKVVEDAAARQEKEKSWEPVSPPFSDEARFDKWFVHAASYLQLSTLPDREMAWSAMHPDYGVAFGVSRRGGEGGSDYVSRLCFLVDGLKDKCKGVPHEFRAALVDRAFLETLLGNVKAYRAETVRGKVFDDVARKIGEAIEGALKSELAFKEDLVLPSTLAPIGGRSGVRVVISEQTGVVATTDTDVKLLEKYTGTLPTTLVADVTKLLTDLKDRPGNKIDYQRIILEMPGATSLTTLIQAIRSFPALLGEAAGVKEVFLVGRRRIDESMRLAALKLRIPRADDSPVMSYQFKEDAAKSSCQLMGQVGDPPAGKKNEYYLEVSPERVRATQLAINEETAERTPTDTIDLGTGADLTKAKEWIEANPGRMRLFLKVKGDYSAMLTQLTDLLYKCTDEEVTGDDGSKPPLKRTCGVSEARAVTFVLGLCE